MTKGSKTKTIITAAIACALGITCAAGMTGCDAVKGAISHTAVGQKAMSSKTTDSSDREDCWKTVQDINGNEYATVIWMDSPAGKYDIEKEEVKDLLNSKSINWYQLITSDNRSAPNTPEHALLYMPASVTLADMQEVQAILASTYPARVMTAAEYEQYLADAPSDNLMNGINLYSRETTDFGPAAKAE